MSCKDTKEKFLITSNIWVDDEKDCSWASDELKRCAAEEVKQNCPVTCDACPTISPSFHPSESPSEFSTTLSPSISKQPSSSPSISNQPSISSQPSSISNQPSINGSPMLDIGPYSIPQQWIEIGIYVVVGLIVFFLCCYRSGKKGGKCHKNGEDYRDEEEYDYEDEDRRRGGRNPRYDYDDHDAPRRGQRGSRPRPRR